MKYMDGEFFHYLFSMKFFLRCHFFSDAVMLTMSEFNNFVS